MAEVPAKRSVLLGFLKPHKTPIFFFAFLKENINENTTKKEAALVLRINFEE